MTLTIYMKSGNKIVLKGIKEYKVTSSSKQVTSLTIVPEWFWDWIPGNSKLLVSTIVLSQIEAITLG